MNFTLRDLIDIEQFQSLQDRLNEIYSFPSAIIDNDGNVLTATAWQDVCTRFHRQHEECLKECIKSDQYILSHLDEAHPAVSYHCPHGLVDNATPIIIDGQHLGNFFTGQFFLEAPDLGFFREQAKRYGFDETAYLEAVQKVPIWTQEQLNSYLFFIKGLIEVITNVGLKNLREIETREKLRESEARYRTVADFTFDWEYWIDPAGRTIYCSPSCERICGYRAEEFEKTPGLLIDIVHPEDRPRAIQHMSELADPRHESCEQEFRVVTRAGETRWIAHVCTAVMDSDGVFRGRRGSNRDITDRKWAETERERLKKQIQHAQKLESLGVLAGGIAHDFNNILMVILGNADLALQDLSPLAPARPSIEEVVTAARRAADLTRQMLAYSGKGRFIIQRLDLSEAVREMAHLLEASVSKKAYLNLNLGSGLPAIEADTAQIQQIVMNLIINASEALDEERGGTITVLTEFRHFTETDLTASRLPEKPRTGGYVCIEVSDTGCGMSKETLENLFDPFYTTKFTGRGLGMSAVLGIVRGHKGAITVESTLGHGTIIRVSFPALEEPAPSLEENPTVSGVLSHQTGMVLFVDDEPLARNLGKQMLERMGHTVLTAADGVEAVDVFEKHARDIACVILDLSMPRMDGEQVFRRLREMDKNCRVILASGYSEREIEERFAGQGIRAFLQKPYTLKILSEKLRSVFG